MIPTLRTERLILRGPSMGDLPGITAFMTSDRAQFVGGPLDADKIWPALCANAGQWHLRGYGIWQIERQSDGALIGRAGIYHPADWPEPELTWALYDAIFEGQGYASEAATAARDMAQQFGLTRLASHVADENAASVAVAKRLGAKDEGLHDTPVGPMRRFRHPAPAAPIIPEQIETERLILKRPSDSDRAAYIGFYTSDRSAMALGPKSPDDASAFFDQECALWDDKGFGMYSLFAKSDPNTPAGLVGLWHPSICAEPELGWLLWDHAEGNGYATEAARACLDMWLGGGKLAPISYITANNAASQAVARKLGAHIETMHPNHPNLQIWRHKRDLAQ